MDKNAESLLQDFTGLRNTKPGLETWISVGGWTFNDETNRPKYVSLFCGLLVVVWHVLTGVFNSTRHAFSDMASTAANGAKFIKSIIHFMSTYGFQGVDIDWGTPAPQTAAAVRKTRPTLSFCAKKCRWPLLASLA